MKTNTASIILLKVLSMVMLMTLSACGSQSNSIQTYIKKMHLRKAPPVESIPKIKPALHFTYTANSLRSPFVASSRKVLGKQLMPDPSRNKEALEVFPLDALRIVGTMEIGSAPWALIAGPDQTIYRVTIGNFVGQDFGRISAIGKTVIKIEEIISDGAGGWLNKPRLLSLNEKANS